MIIAIDFDGTYTADPVMMHRLIYGLCVKACGTSP